MTPREIQLTLLCEGLLEQIHHNGQYHPAGHWWDCRRNICLRATSVLRPEALLEEETRAREDHEALASIVDADCPPDQYDESIELGMRAKVDQYRE
jgi:hypothetical protein